MFLAHRKPTFAAALAVFSIALPLGNLAFAQFDSSTTIANAERAAQSVIVPSPTRSHVELPAASSEAVTLAQNERAAQRAIVGVPFSRTATLPGRYDTLGGVSLARAERAAQQVIVGAPVAPRTSATAHAASSIGAATGASDTTFAHGN